MWPSLSMLRRYYNLSNNLPSFRRAIYFIRKTLLQKVFNEMFYTILYHDVLLSTIYKNKYRSILHSSAINLIKSAQRNIGQSHVFIEHMCPTSELHRNFQWGKLLQDNVMKFFILYWHQFSLHIYSRKCHTSLGIWDFFYFFLL